MPLTSNGQTSRKCSTQAQRPDYTGLSIALRSRCYHSISQMRRLRLREGLVQGHTVSTQQGKEARLGLLDAKWVPALSVRCAAPSCSLVDAPGAADAAGQHPTPLLGVPPNSYTMSTAICTLHCVLFLRPGLARIMASQPQHRAGKRGLFSVKVT